MSSLPSHHNIPQIPPVADGTLRPLWSVMIPTYNCADYLKKTLEYVLAQDPGPDVMQIEVVDDCSTRGDHEAVVRAIAGDRVEFYQQPQNVGHTRNFNTCLQRARGHLVHLLHGDDGVRPEFYQTMQRPFLEHPEIGAAFCRCIFLDAHENWVNISTLDQLESGTIPNWLELLAEGQRLQTPSMVVRREVYERLGGFDESFAWYGEDWEMWVRISAEYTVWHEIAPLALYRIHGTSLTGQSTRTGVNAQEYRRAIEINHARLPQNRAEELSQRARLSFALASLRRAHRMLDKGVTDGPYAQAREALRTSRAPLVIIRSASVIVRWLWTHIYLRWLARKNADHSK